MRHGKLITEESNWAKTERDKNKKLHNALVEAKANGDYYETIDEIKAMPLEEVAKRLRTIKSPDNSLRNAYDWTALDNARWERLAWRARQLGISNPFTLVKN